MKKNKKPRHNLSGKTNLSDRVLIPEMDKPKVFIALSVIVLISLMAYLPVFHNGLLNWDDDGYIKNNLMIRSFNLKEIFSAFVLGNWHPLTMLVFTIEYQLFGLNPSGYHTVNLILHLANVVLVFYMVYLISDKVAVALVSSLLFGIHPLHVESVAWAAELKDLLYTLFFLASYICYLKYIIGNRQQAIGNRQQATEKETESPGEGTLITNPRPRGGTIYESRHQRISTSAHQHVGTSAHYYILSLVLFAFSLLSKAMAASLPLILILTDYFKGRKIDKWALVEKTPFFLLAVIFGVVAIIAQKSSIAIHGIVGYTFPQHLVFAAYGFVSYLIKLAFPINLSAFYPYSANRGNGIPLQYYTFLLIFIALAVYIVYSRRFTNKIIFGMGFFTITVLLVLQILPVGMAIMADRYSYIPSIGIFYLAGEGLLYLWNKKIKWSRTFAIALLGVAVVLFSVKTYARCGVWKNDEIFWSDVISRYQTIAVSYYNRGIVYLNERRFNEAVKDFNKAIELNPNYTEAYFGRGNLYMNEKRSEDALNDYNKAIELNPKYAEAYLGRGILFLNEGKDNEALKYFNKAIELKPGFADAYTNRSVVFVNENKNAEAISDLNKAIELKPDNKDAYTYRGLIYMNEKRIIDALNDFNKVIELDPGNAESYYNLGILFMNEKRNTDALKYFNKVIELKPDFAEAYVDRGNLFRNEKRNAEAIGDFNKAIELNPVYPNVYNNRGLVFANENRNDEAMKDFNKAIELNPQYAAAYTNKANLFFKEKRYEEAIKIYSMAIALKTDYAQAYFNRGFAEFYSGNKVAACTDFKKAVSLGYKPAEEALTKMCK